jgi:hypothetical protein
MALKQHVILAAGHGGGDSGAVAQGTTEANETISITDHLVSKLNADGRIKVSLVPHSQGLQGAIDHVNSLVGGLEDALALEIHKNSGGGNGSEVWAPSYPDATSKSMAAKIAAQMSAVTGQPNRGVKEAQNNRWGRLGFTDDTKCYALLIEAGFIDVNPVGTSANERYAEGIFKGLLDVFGLGAKAPTPPPAPAPAPVTERKIERYTNTVMYMVKPGLLDDKAKLWNTTFTDWATAKAVTSVPRLKADGTPTPIEIAGEIKHPLGAVYLVTKSSADRNTANGFNRNDLTLYVPPSPVEQPNVPTEVPVEPTPKPTEPTPTTPPQTDQPDTRDTEQDARIGALEAAVAGLITLLLSIGKAIVDGVSKLKK